MSVRLHYAHGPWQNRFGCSCKQGITCWLRPCTGRWGSWGRCEICCFQDSTQWVRLQTLGLPPSDETETVPPGSGCRNVHTLHTPIAVASWLPHNPLLPGIIQCYEVSPHGTTVSSTWLSQSEAAFYKPVGSLKTIWMCPCIRGLAGFFGVKMASKMPRRLVPTTGSDYCVVCNKGVSRGSAGVCNRCALLALAGTELQQSKKSVLSFDKAMVDAMWTKSRGPVAANELYPWKSLAWDLLKSWLVAVVFVTVVPPGDALWQTDMCGGRS